MKTKPQKRMVVQIPIKSELKTNIEEVAKKEGFDSLQAFTRFLYNKIVNKELHISLKQPPVEYISPQYEAYLDQREKETLEAIKNGTAYTASSGEEFIKQILSDDEED